MEIWNVEANPSQCSQVMNHRSLTFFTALSVAAHVVLFGLSPATEQDSLRLQESYIEIGMVSLPQVNTDFTQDRSQQKKAPSINNNQSTAQEPVIAKAQLQKTAVRQSTETQSPGATKTVAPIETINHKNKKNPLHPASTLSSSQPDTSPAAATKAAPLYSKNPAPDYPATALRYGWEGEVWLKVVVSSSGEVEKVVIEQSSNYQVLDQAAVKTVRMWRFKPARIGNTATKGSIRVPIRFKIKRT
jgi:protein TonB